MTDAAPLLLRLLDGADDITGLLDPAVVYARGDGAVLVGRDAVRAAFAAGDGATYRVVSVAASAVEVALALPDVPGALRFTLSGACARGVLTAISVRVR